MRIQLSHIRDGEGTIWSRMIRFLMECNGCILVSILLSRYPSARFVWRRTRIGGYQNMRGRLGQWDIGIYHFTLLQSIFFQTKFHFLFILSIVCLLCLTTSPFSHHQLTPPPPRRRHAHNHKPHPLARNWRRHRPPTRLVPRPRHRILLHEPRIWHLRTRRRTTQHVLPYGSRLSNRRTEQESVSGDVLFAAGPTPSEYDGECWG